MGLRFSLRAMGMCEMLATFGPDASCSSNAKFEREVGATCLAFFFSSALREAMERA